MERNIHTPYYLQALLGLLPLVLGIQLLAWLIVFPAAMRGHADFRQLYTAGFMVRTGHAAELYNYDAQLQFQNKLVSPAQVPLPFIRPAYYALLFVPFSALSYREAYLSFLFCNVILLCISYRILQPWLRSIAGVWSWLPAFFFVGFYPVAGAFMQGQDSILLLTLLASAFICLNRGRNFSAGLLTGLGLFKFQIVIPIVLLFLAWRRWRFSAGFGVSALVAGALSVSLVGLTQLERYMRSLISMNTALPPRPNDLSYPIPVEFMPNLHGLVVGISSHHVPAFWAHIGSICLSAAVWLWVAAAMSRRRMSAELFPVAIAASAVVSYYLFLYDLSIMLIPMALLLDRQMQPGVSDGLSEQLAGWIIFSGFVTPLFDPFVPRYRYLMSLPVCALLLVLVLRCRRAAVNLSSKEFENTSTEIAPLTSPEAS
jgi:hypothetical protein